jgi:8-oxo-dGTP diphosphatase
MPHWSERHRIVPAVYLVLRRNGKVLCARRFNTGYRDGNYSLPAGHVDGNESAATAMVREAAEEVGVVMSAANLKLVHVMHRRVEEGDYEYVDFYFEPSAWTGEPSIKEPDKCDDLRWCALDGLPENTVPVVRQALQHIASGVMYSDANFVR